MPPVSELESPKLKMAGNSQDPPLELLTTVINRHEKKQKKKAEKEDISPDLMPPLAFPCAGVKKPQGEEENLMMMKI